MTETRRPSSNRARPRTRVGMTSRFASPRKIRSLTLRTSRRRVQGVEQTQNDQPPARTLTRVCDRIGKVARLAFNAYKIHEQLPGIIEQLSAWF